MFMVAFFTILQFISSVELEPNEELMEKRAKFHTILVLKSKLPSLYADINNRSYLCGGFLLNHPIPEEANVCRKFVFSSHEKNDQAKVDVRDLGQVRFDNIEVALSKLNIKERNCLVQYLITLVKNMLLYKEKIEQELKNIKDKETFILNEDHQTYIDMISVDEQELEDLRFQTIKYNQVAFFLINRAIYFLRLFREIYSKENDKAIKEQMKEFIGKKNEELENFFLEINRVLQYSISVLGIEKRKDVKWWKPSGKTVELENNLIKDYTVNQTRMIYIFSGVVCGLSVASSALVIFFMIKNAKYY